MGRMYDGAARLERSEHLCAESSLFVAAVRVEE